MDNRLRETAVTVAVWASSQHAIAEVWFAGPRIAANDAPGNALEIIVVMADHTHQVEARRAGRQVSTINWEADIKRAVRERHVLQTVATPPLNTQAQAVRIFSRRAEAEPEIRCSSNRAEAPGERACQNNLDTRGDIGNVRTL